VNTIERAVRVSDATLCQTTLTGCCDVDVVTGVTTVQGGGELDYVISEIAADVILRETPAGFPGHGRRNAGGRGRPTATSV